MRFPTSLLRRLVESSTEKAFDRGIFWGIGGGVFLTHLYYQDRMKKQRSY
jgi:hypothetical protein